MLDLHPYAETILAVLQELHDLPGTIEVNDDPDHIHAELRLVNREEYPTYRANRHEDAGTIALVRLLKPRWPGMNWTAEVDVPYRETEIRHPTADVHAHRIARWIERHLPAPERTDA